MKALIAALTLYLLGALPLLAEPPPEPAAQNNRGGETRMLRHLLEMQPEELAALRQTIERIERMSSEEKIQLRERLGKLEKMAPEHIDAMRKRFQSIAPETREAMRQRWLEMTPETRSEWRQKLRTMSREERAQVFEEQGFLPIPGNGPKPSRPARSESSEE